MQQPSLLFLILLFLDVNVFALPSPQDYHKYEHLACNEDNPLRALERHTSAANGFCPGFLSTNGKGDPPQQLGKFKSWEFYSACSCYEKTATGHGNPTTGPVNAHPTSSKLPSSNRAAVLKDVSPTHAPNQYQASSAALPSIPLETGKSPTNDNSVQKSTPPNATTTPPPLDPANSTKATPTAESLPTADSTGVANTPAGPVNPSSKGKRGIAYNYKSQPSWSALFKGSPFAVWGSNWDDKRTSALDLSFAYVPTIVVDSSLSNSDWLSAIPALLASGTTTLFGSNEPDNAGQANLPPATAAAVHKKYLQPFASHASLGTPAITNGGAPSGLTYLDAFATACADNCTFNFINVHFYLPRSSFTPAQFAEKLKQHLDVDLPAVQDQHANLKGLPVMLGEFWLTDASPQDGVDLLQAVLPYLDSNEKVMGYQAFGGLWEGNWISSDGSGLTPQGETYKTYSAAA